MLVFHGNNLKYRCWYFTNTSGKNLGLELWTKMLPANQIVGFFKMQYFKNEVNDDIYFLHADKHRSLLQVDTIILVTVTRHAQSTKNKFACLCNISIKAWGIKLILCLQINNRFLHDSMTLDARTQTCPKYRKQQGYNILRMPQGKHEGWSWFFACW